MLALEQAVQQALHSDGRHLNLPSAQQDVLDVRSYTGYFGTYEVDVKRSVVTHHVEGGTLLGYIGTAQERPFRLDGDKLIIGDDKTWRRVLERVRTSSRRGRSSERQLGKRATADALR